MKLINDVLLDMVQGRIEKAVFLNLLSKNITPTKRAVENEVAKKLVKLADKLSEMAWSE